MAVVARRSSFVIFVTEDFRAWIWFWRKELEKMAPDGLSTGMFFRYFAVLFFVRVYSEVEFFFDFVEDSVRIYRSGIWCLRE